ncbi:SDR family oxidoreductase [Crossiella sp. CA-258035]|uniref:SDR family oxidoreductase n=1 Tax=Crossiella sp. CA-258035 TaxID=2981138 RepID=UPI0024BCF325|nr:SDR family oxidoreductase [Crossiella sp. CA-258035]WHT23347.1 SDR family oxidoreductase [Crossiella sp. CA-258035]
MADDPDLGLNGRAALVIGGSRGIGRAVARRLCAAGAHVTVAYGSSGEDARETVAELSGLSGSIIAVQQDVRQPGAVPTLVTGVCERHGRLDVVVHCATAVRRPTAGGLDPGTVRETQSIVLDPLLYGAEAIVKAMAGGPGRVVVMSSAGAGRAVPGYGSHGIVKAALESAVRYLAAELAGHGIAVNAVSTAKVDKGIDGPGREALAVVARRTPGGRATTPEDVAGVVALLCTDDARWIHGQVITVDGGLSIVA